MLIWLAAASRRNVTLTCVWKYPSAILPRVREAQAVLRDHDYRVIVGLFTGRHLRQHPFPPSLLLPWPSSYVRRISRWISPAVRWRSALSLVVCRDFVERRHLALSCYTSLPLNEQPSHWTWSRNKIQIRWISHWHETLVVSRVDWCYTFRFTTTLGRRDQLGSNNPTNVIQHNFHGTILPFHMPQHPRMTVYKSE